MTKDTPLPPLPDAPFAAITNNKMAFTLLGPPSPTSPALHQCAGMANLFRDSSNTDTNKRVSDLSSMGYSSAKKKGGSCTHGTDISPCNEFDMCNADACVVSDKEEDEDYSPTPAYKLI
jgi:hypothetical protein